MRSVRSSDRPVEKQRDFGRETIYAFPEANSRLIQTSGSTCSLCVFCGFSRLAEQRAARYRTDHVGYESRWPQVVREFGTTRASATEGTAKTSKYLSSGRDDLYERHPASNEHRPGRCGQVGAGSGGTASSRPRAGTG